MAHVIKIIHFCAT